MEKRIPLVKWQLPMKRVLYALTPIAVSAVYFYGGRVILVLAVCNGFGFLTEYAFTCRWKQPVSSAVFVTATLFAMSLPPNLPIPMAVLGVVFGVVFGKMVFGGFGKNIFNPALTGRAFVYVCFGGYMTTRWDNPVPGVMGGLLSYRSDAVTQATPGMLMKAGESVGLLDLFLGNTAGVIGGTSALLVILGGFYLLRTKAANYRIIVAGLLGFVVAQGILFLGGVKGAANPVSALLAGSVLFGLFFYATDPVSAPNTNPARWIYGAFIGAMSSLISVFSVWPAGTMFAILLANMFAPITDYAVNRLKKRPKDGGAVA